MPHPNLRVLRNILGDPADWSGGDFEYWLHACDAYRAVLASWMDHFPDMTAADVRNTPS
ncbi:hypothetical protein [Streptomyces sp. YPW6]|uniref:hypothetical protein n=1 Tax=Streptomyces sp. YPW6 TaxID=2840373 RepID=UPI003EBB9E26